MARTAVFTIVSNNYLHFARVLLESVKTHQPTSDRYCVIVDDDLVPACALADEFSAISVADLRIPELRKFLFRYSILEANTAVKPWAFAHLLEQGYERVVYIDPDIALYRPMTEVFEALDGGATGVLTPHLLSPIDDRKQPGELEILRAGTYNLGFFAVRNCAAARQLVSWWQSKLEYDCVVDVERGLFVDQKWMDLVPGMFPGVAVLRHPGYNVAYWNLAQRKVTREGGDFLVDGEPLVFFHYSGFNPREPGRFSKHQDRLALRDLGAAIPLVEDYGKRVQSAGLERFVGLAYGYGRFRDGTPVTDALRIAYRREPDLQRAMGEDPFSKPEAFMRPVPSFSGSDTTWAEYAVWKMRPDLQQQFPSLRGLYGQDYARWFITNAGAYIPKALVDPVVRRVTAAQSGLPAQRMHAPADHLGADAVFRLYMDLLGRTPDSAALSHFAGRCHSLYGYIDTAMRVFLSPESRRRGLGVQRWRSLAALMVRHPGSRPVRRSGHMGTVSDTSASVSEALHTAAAAPNVELDSSVEPVSIMMRKPPCHSIGINVIGYLRTESGVGESARACIRSALAAGIEVSAVDVGFQATSRQTDTCGWNADEAGLVHPISLVHVNADQTPSAVTHLQTAYPACNGVRVGYWHWELPELPIDFAGSFAGLAEVWTPTRFVQDAVAQISPLPVFRVPHAISFTPSPNASRGRFGLPESSFLFLVMYDLLSYQERKNPAAAIRAYRQAFGNRSDVGLVIKTINAEAHKDKLAELEAAVADLPNVHFIHGYLSRQEVYDLESVCDGLISLHRSEGFGLALAEMMYLGKPVVATNWSGNTDFMTSRNSCPVDYELLEIRESIGPYQKGQHWAEADEEHAAFLLRRVVDDAEFRDRIGTRAAADVRAQLSPAAIGRIYSRRLGLLAARHR